MNLVNGLDHFENEASTSTATGLPKSQYVGYLNEAQLRPRFKKSLDLQISS